jgi:hypothetical protein
MEMIADHGDAILGDVARREFCLHNQFFLYK